MGDRLLGRLILHDRMIAWMHGCMIAWSDWNDGAEIIYLSRMALT